MGPGPYLNQMDTGGEEILVSRRTADAH
ncbi:hypothetical protein SBA5_250090 [Candidatus Sulfotelmatomonas gaucii]|uniref:Uncharacterized protein n=1 Tax=Candidatus Sulfuritelmatomonas gaucii TaxID=2043161 RepID=A0A2N9L9C4_9BACT|nr:hypothetical protein SBA5_250090 [Candidatus Sulfotelmatomonas gaucii]